MSSTAVRGKGKESISSAAGWLDKMVSLAIKQWYWVLSKSWSKDYYNYHN